MIQRIFIGIKAASHFFFSEASTRATDTGSQNRLKFDQTRASSCSPQHKR
jgi:hypothetical protein